MDFNVVATYFYHAVYNDNRSDSSSLTVCLVI